MRRPFLLLWQQKIHSNLYQPPPKNRIMKQVINRWAPPTENHTTDYVRFVARESGLDIMDELDFNDKMTMKKIISAMALYECGEKISEKIIADAIKLL